MTAPRAHGVTTFSFMRLLGLSVEGLTSFSVAPLRVASLLGVLHEATTIHVRCAEHGELIHRDATIANTASADREAVVRDLRVETKPSHEHCSLTSATRDSRLVPRPPAIVSAPVIISSFAIAGPLVAVARGGDLYRTAPKTSPPISHGDA